VAIRRTRDALGRTRAAIGRVFYQRCFYLFGVLVVLISAVPFVEPTVRGRMFVVAINTFVLIAAVAAVGRTLLSFVIVLLLAAPAALFNLLAIAAGDAEMLALSWAFAIGLYAATVGYLLRYVFQPDVMTADKLFGAAAAYLLIGVLWAFGYALGDYRYPGSFSIGGKETPLQMLDALYFSFTVLTSTGFGDIVPLTRQARAICVIEQLAGTLFLAILIARLAGVYPPARRG
jgi:hypothetical protein